MKTLKNSFGVFAAILGRMMAFAFTASQPKANQMDNQWFKYTGGGESDPSNYELIDVSSCVSGSFLCAILAPEESGSGHPTQAGVDEPIETTQQPTEQQ